MDPFDGNITPEEKLAFYYNSTVRNSGDTSWVLICAALVLVQTPGLAQFYGGKSIILLYSYHVSFSDSHSHLINLSKLKSQ